MLGKQKIVQKIAAIHASICLRRLPSHQLTWKCKKALSKKGKVVFLQGSVHFHVSWWEGIFSPVGFKRNLSLLAFIFCCGLKQLEVCEREFPPVVCTATQRATSGVVVTGAPREAFFAFAVTAFCMAHFLLKNGHSMGFGDWKGWTYRTAFFCGTARCGEKKATHVEGASPLRRPEVKKKGAGFDSKQLCPFAKNTVSLSENGQRDLLYVFVGNLSMFGGFLG